jgi:outer membrane lipoprotein-sorting protein
VLRTRHGIGSLLFATLLASGVPGATGAAGAAGAAGSAEPLDAESLIRHFDRLWRGDTSRSSMTMTVKTLRYERTMTMEAWSRGKDYSLVVIREPVKDRDVATLKVEDNIWNYLPKINRVTKVPSSMMSGSWMGSHFTNDDLVRDSSFEDDYRSSISFQGHRDGQQVVEITSVARPDAPVVWGKVVTLVDFKTLAPLSSRYHDEAGALIRTMTYDRPKPIGERIVPMRMRLQPQDKPDESTVIEYHDITFGVPLEASFFSLQSLQRRR